MVQSYLVRRFKVNNADVKGINNSFLRIKIEKTTGEIIRVNANNWTEQASNDFNHVYPKSKMDISNIKFRRLDGPKKKTKKPKRTQKEHFTTFTNDNLSTEESLNAFIQSYKNSYNYEKIALSMLKLNES
tara:strand:- start:46 stop:435 length:390 start_codon:yes stop_codon:yes gene_type:complete